MAIIQAIIAFIGRSAGKILNAIFGWSVRALFGGVSGRQATLLTILVALAALWPLLLVGIIAPRAAAFLVAFIPIPKSVSENAVRMVWIALALLLPGILGLVIAAKKPPGSPPEPFLMRVARGYPTTLGIALAFFISFVSVPLLRLASAARGHTDVDIPLITTAAGYHEIATEVRRVLNARRFQVEPCEPRFWVRAPMMVMRYLAGDAMRHYLPEHLVHMRGPGLEIAFYPASVLLRGPQRKTVLAHGLIVEALTPLSVYQTTALEAQDLERQITQVWSVLAENREAHVDSFALRLRLRQIIHQLLHLEVSYDDWQTVYRETLQLARALQGKPQLLAEEKEETMDRHYEAEPHSAKAPEGVQQLSTTEILSEIASQATVLMNKELALARAEIDQQLQAELTAIKSAAVAAVAALVGLNLLFVAAVLALTPYIAPWLAALILAAIALLTAVGLTMVARGKHVSRPLEVTRRTLVDDVRWAEERLA